MKLPRLAIDNFQFMIIAVLLLLIMGVTSFLTMPRTEDPAVTAPGASIVVIFPGASPSDLEELVATPVEEAINELTDIKKFQSSLRNNLAYFSVEFEPDQDADEKYNEVVQIINSIKSSLPDEITDIEIKQFTITDVSILQMALMSADAEYRDMKTVAESMKKDLEKVQGVMSVKIHALPEAEIRVEPDFGKMAKLNISLEQVTVAIQSSNTNIPGGELEMGSRVFNIKTSGSYSSIEDIKNTVVSFTNGKLILLRDIAEVGFRYEDQAYFARFNGQRSVFITVTQKENTNIFSISEKLKEIVDKYSHELPQNMKLEAVFDQSESVNSRINGFLSNLFQGVVLVGAVIFFAIGTRASIIVILAIPMSIFIGLGFVDLSGFGLQQISIAGLVVALGLLVDNAIVITENITRFIEMGHSKRQAAILGTQQIGWPMVSSTVTTLLAFIPIIMMRDKAGDFIRSMPLTVVYTLSASLLLALTFYPYLAAKFLPDFKPEKKIKKPKGSAMQRFIDGYYTRILTKSLQHRGLVIVVAFVIFAGSAAMFPLIGVSFFPKAEKSQFMVDVVTPDGSSLAYTDSIAIQTEQIIDSIPEVQFFATNVGHGNPKIYYNIFPKSFAKNYAQIFVQLEEYREPFFSDLMDSVRNKLSNRAEAQYRVREFDQGPPIEAPIVVRVIGKNLKTLKGLAAKVEQMLYGIEGAFNIDNQMAGERTDI
ncbi:MAG: efflux RND transporter permease subunit, partial [Bacteroidetes bacterium]|nr:efflux RND transporter permease subunit [Bacteroidota bacterium]MBU1719991.1 efflux RND transporter permease subunit [Bacteroidota bacterium]